MQKVYHAERHLTGRFFAQVSHRRTSRLLAQEKDGLAILAVYTLNRKEPQVVQTITQEQQVASSIREIVYCFQMLGLQRACGMRVMTRDAAGYEIYVMQLRKNIGGRTQMIEYRNGRPTGTAEDADLYRFTHWLKAYIERSAHEPGVSQLDMHFDHATQALGDAAKLSWAIGRGQVALGSVW